MVIGQQASHGDFEFFVLEAIQVELELILQSLSDHHEEEQIQVESECAVLQPLPDNDDE
jgi:hypothetical protein